MFQSCLPESVCMMIAAIAAPSPSAASDRIVQGATDDLMFSSASAYALIENINVEIIDPVWKLI